MGISDEVDLSSPATLGLRLVSVLSAQLDGTCTLDRGGTRFTMTFAAQSRS